MKNSSPRVDDYIERAADFAKPILKRLRKLFHQACPMIREEMKWGAPFFVNQGIIGCMAAFKQHVSWGFWNAKLIPGLSEALRDGETLSGFGLKPRRLADLPKDKVILDYIRSAVALDEQGVKRPAPKRKPVATIEIPKELKAALKQNPKAKTVFDDFSPGHQREYIEWITEAKQDATRERRVATTIEWLTAGKSRNWKYMKK